MAPDDGLPSFMRGNPWLEILSRRGSGEEPRPIAVSRPSVEGVHEELAAQPTSAPTQAPQPCPSTDTADAGGVLREVRQLLQNFRVQQTNIQGQPMVIVIPVYVPVPGLYPAPYVAGPEPSGEKRMILCPKCGRYGTPQICRKTKNGKTYAYLHIYHGDKDVCYIGSVLRNQELLRTFQELGDPSGNALNQASFAERVVRPPGFEPGLQAREA